MNFSLRRTITLIKLKAHNIYINQMVVASLFIPILIALIGVLFFKKYVGIFTVENQKMLLINASLVNIIYLGISIPALLMAEEKEKNTLRVLMVSSVTGLEYFIGVLMPSLLLMTGIQLLLIPLLEITITMNGIITYGTISLLTVFISNVIGMCFGLILKDQMSATLAPIPVIFLFWMVPLITNMNATTQVISMFFYSSLIPQAISSLLYQVPLNVPLVQWGVFAGELLIAILVFLFLYRKNGYEAD